MSIPKQFINVIGTLIVLAALVAGILLAALPMYTQSLTTTVDALLAAQTNSIYSEQVRGLRAEEARFAEIQADVDALQTQIPGRTRTDDLFEIVGNAAAAAGVTVVGASALDPIAWVPRTAPESDDAAAPAEAPAADPAADAAAQPEPPVDGTEPAGEAPVVAAESPALEFAFAIIITTDDPAKAALFIDLLGAGPRLLSVVHSELVEEDDALRLTVNALAFVRTEG